MIIVVVIIVVVVVVIIVVVVVVIIVVVVVVIIVVVVVVVVAVIVVVVVVVIVVFISAISEYHVANTLCMQIRLSSTLENTMLTRAATRRSREPRALRSTWHSGLLYRNTGRK